MNFDKGWRNSRIPKKSIPRWRESIPQWPESIPRWPESIPHKVYFLARKSWPESIPQKSRYTFWPGFPRQKVYLTGQKVYLPGQKVYLTGQILYLTGQKVYLADQKVYLAPESIPHWPESIPITGQKNYCKMGQLLQNIQNITKRCEIDKNHQYRALDGQK